MKTETLIKAKELEANIDRLKRHIKDIKTNSEKPYDPSLGSVSIFIEGIDSSKHKALRLNLLPINIENFVDLYLMNCEKELKKLESELEKL